MGEYWKLVNVTKKQSIHPHEVDCGLKFREWADYESPVILRARALVAAGQWDPADELRAVSDYDSNRQLLLLSTLEWGPNEDGGRVMYEDDWGEHVSAGPRAEATPVRDIVLAHVAKMTDEQLHDLLESFSE